MLARDSFLSALLAALSLARYIEDGGFEKKVVEELDHVVKKGLLETPMPVNGA